MIIASPLFSLKRMSDSWRKNYTRRNMVCESCNGVKPSVKIKAGNAVKAVGSTIATEITKSTIV